MPRPRKRVKLEGEELRYPGEVQRRNEDVLTNKSLGIHLIDEEAGLRC